MSSKFTSDFFAGNRKNLRQTVDSSVPIVLAANGLLQRGGDTSYPFCQDASFWYLTGCDEPDLLLVCNQDESYLIVPKREASRMAFDGSVDSEELSKTSGISLVLDETEGWKRLGAQLSKTKQVATVIVPPEYIEPLGLFSNPARKVLSAKLNASHAQLELVDITKQLARLRSVKQAPEMRALQAAIDLTTTSLTKIFKSACDGGYSYEYEIEADLDRDFRRGGRGQAFAPIVASGERACILHNIANKGRLAQDQLLLCDVGADYDHYAADISRTISLGVPTSRQKEVHAAVMAAQDFALGLLRPGVVLKDYEREVESFVGQKLKQLGLIRTINRKQVRRFMPHAVSHFLGLNAHDIGLYDQPLEAGMVITVEPGIYIPDEAIGIRIEDDICITKQGSQVLSQTLSRDLT